MYTVIQCKTDKMMGQAKTLKGAIKLASSTLADGLDNVVEEHGRFVCFSDGVLTEPEMLPYHERCGSVLTGREQD